MAWLAARLIARNPLAAEYVDGWLSKVNKSLRFFSVMKWNPDELVRQ